MKVNDIIVMAHRGASARAPQNTMPAFKKAAIIGAHGIETDVHLTLDGIPVICHNYDIDETSNGKGLISEKNYDELIKYDFGSYYSSIYSNVKIPSLSEVFEFCVNTDFQLINVEIKEPKHKNNISQKVISLAKEYGLFDKLLISSFSPQILIECKQIDINVKTGFLYSPSEPLYIKKLMFGYVGFAKEIKADYLHPHFSLVNNKYVSDLHKNGIGVNTWTVDTVDAIKKMINCSVDGIISNKPDLVMNVIENSEV